MLWRMTPNGPSEKPRSLVPNPERGFQGCSRPEERRTPQAGPGAQGTRLPLRQTGRCRNCLTEPELACVWHCYMDNQ